VVSFCPWGHYQQLYIVCPVPGASKACEVKVHQQGLSKNGAGVPLSHVTGLNHLSSGKIKKIHIRKGTPDVCFKINIVRVLASLFPIRKAHFSALACCWSDRKIDLIWAVGFVLD